MRKMKFILLMSFVYAFGFAQLAQEGFEAGWTLAPIGTSSTGWFTMQNDVGLNFLWMQGPANNAARPAYEGAHAAYLEREQVLAGMPEDYLVTPQFVVPDMPEIRFFSRLTVPEDQGSIYKIFIVDLTGNPSADINSPAAYTELQSWTELQLNPVQTEYIEKVVNIPAAYVGKNVRIAFMMAGDFMDRWLIDNVKVVKKCLAPDGLNVQDVGLTNATLLWDNPDGVSSWEIEIIGEDDMPSGTGVQYGDPLPISLTNLTEDTCYKYYVRSACAGGFSDWAGPYHFCTKRQGDDCSVPIDITGLPYTGADNTAGFANAFSGMPGANCGNNSWEDYLSGNDVVYKYTAGFTGAVTIDLTDNGPNSGIFIYDECSDITFNCLGGGTSGQEGNSVHIEEFPVTSGEDYYIIISSYLNPTTPYRLTLQQVTCDEPQNLSVSNVAMASVQLSWENPSGADAWEVAVNPLGTGVPSGSGTAVTDNTDYLWMGLTGSSSYEYWVRADCGNGIFSAWAGPLVFNTMACNALSQCEFTFTMFDAQDTWNGHTMTVKQNGLAIATLTGPGPDGEPVNQVVNVCDGIPVQLFWNAGGTPGGASEIGINVVNTFGQNVYTKNFDDGAQNTVLYEGMVDCDAPSCLSPVGFSVENATETTVDISWEGPATGEWEYYIVPVGYPAPDPETVGTITTTNPTIGVGTFTASSNYLCYLRTHCENASTDISEWGVPHAFSTSVCPPAEKCEYTFNLNSLWGNGWAGAKMTVRQGGTDVAILGEDFVAGTSQSVTVLLCPDVAFEIFWDEGGAWEGNVGLEVINNFDQLLYELPVTTEGILQTVIFQTTMNCSFPACLPPAGLTASNGTMTSIDLAWDGAEMGNWEYIILPAGSPAPTAGTAGTPTTANPTVDVPLAAPATQYDYYLRTVCSGAATPSSDWSGPHEIRSEACESDVRCMYHFELLSMNGWGAESHTMTVYQSGIEIITLGPGFDDVAPDNYSYIVDVALCSDIPIEIVWNIPGWGAGLDEDKGLRIYSPNWEELFLKDFGIGTQGDTIFAGTLNCSPPACLRPWNLEVTNIGLTSVQLQWDTQGESAAGWEVWVLPFGSPMPDPATTPGLFVTTNSVVWEGLSVGTPYVYYVRANCGDDGLSTITGPKVFVTAIENDHCNNATALVVNERAECISTAPGTVTGSTTSGMFPFCLGTTPENDVWYSFVATDQDLIVSLNDVQGTELGFAVYEGDCDNLNQLTCITPGWPDIISVNAFYNLTQGATYYVQVFPIDVLREENPSYFNICVSTITKINVDTSLAVDDIVANVLVSESCANVENISWSTGSDFGNVNGIGYFEQGLSDFDIPKGILIMTGDANGAAGPNLGERLSSGMWPGDDELFNYIMSLGIDPGLGFYNDASVLEFDFTPFADKLRFPFIFASEEYGTYQCQFSDAFAFFLTPIDDDGNPVGETINLAVVPETNAPVSVTTIRNSAFNVTDENCLSANEEYFDKYYGNDGVNNPEMATDAFAAPINFQGATKRLYAESDVIKGQRYHIKMVIADRGDSGQDSAVFIGAFEIGKPDLGPDLLVAEDSALCFGTSHTITANLNDDDYTFVWLRSEIPTAENPMPGYTVIVGEADSDYLVSEAGRYKVIVSFEGLCEVEDEIIIEFYPDVEDVTGNPAQLTVCDADGFGTFNLSDNTQVILDGVTSGNPGDYVITYHASAQDAENNENALPLTGYVNVNQGGETIYVRITDGHGCIGIKSFDIVVQDLTPLFTVNEDFTICEHGSGIITVTPVDPPNYDPAMVTYTWRLDGSLLPDTAASITAVAQGVYQVTVNNQGCEATDMVMISVIPTPIADNPADVVACGSYTLPALSANNRYYSGSGGTGSRFNANDVITSSQVVYVIAYSTVLEACFTENSFIVEIIPNAIVSVDETCQGNDYILEAKFDEDSIYNADNVTFSWADAAGTVLGTSETLTITETGSYFLTVTPAGQAMACPTTVEVQVDSTTCLIPRGISPNGDGLNDSFDLSGMDVAQLRIYNRYGQEVYSRANYTNEWIGQGSNGDELPTGTYFYMIKRQNGESKTGWVYINRQE